MNDNVFSLTVLVSGGGTNLQAILDQIESKSLQNVAVNAVISSRSDAYALTRAKSHNIPSFVCAKKDYKTTEEYEQELNLLLKDQNPDLIVLAGYLPVVPEIVVSSFPNRIINIHPSLIPSFCGKGYYGIHVHEAALKRGVKITGATVHFVDEGTDTGPILLQKAVEVWDGDTPQALQQRVMERAEWVILPEAIRILAKRAGF